MADTSASVPGNLVLHSVHLILHSVHLILQSRLPALVWSCAKAVPAAKLSSVILGSC